MYVPKAFEEDQLHQLHALMWNYPFATLITWCIGTPLVTHLPLVLDAERGDQGTLMGHLARKNPQSRHLADGFEALIIFQGPHAYVSPSWYASEFNVPTWNFTAVHAYGLPTVMDDASEVRAILDRQTACYEAQRARPWSIPWADERNHRMLAGLVAFEMAIDRLEGKFKLNQNKTAADRAQVIEALSISHRADDRAMARMIETNESGHKELSDQEGQKHA